MKTGDTPWCWKLGTLHDESQIWPVQFGKLLCQQNLCARWEQQEVWRCFHKTSVCFQNVTFTFGAYLWGHQRVHIVILIYRLEILMTKAFAQR